MWWSVDEVDLIEDIGIIVDEPEFGATFMVIVEI